VLLLPVTTTEPLTVATLAVTTDPLPVALTMIAATKGDAPGVLPLFVVPRGTLPSPGDLLALAEAEVLKGNVMLATN